MTTSDSLPPAWEPLTPRGIAAFARAKVGRLLLVQFIVALLVAAAVVWFLYDGCFPTVREAIRQMPAEGEIRSGKLNWRGESPRLLAEGRFLAFTVDVDHAGDIRSPAHLQLEFGQDDFFAHSLLGYAAGHYPHSGIIPFNRTELLPKWDAWQPALLALAAVGVVAWLMLCWLVLATVYAGPVWLAGFFANRDLKSRASWKLAGAALMPGALLLAGAILLYDFGVLDLVQMAFVFGGHLVLGWIYVGVSPLFLPRHSATVVAGKNPFAPPPAA
jgi:hypothetical protein